MSLPIGLVIQNSEKDDSEAIAEVGKEAPILLRDLDY
jgi:hypothetical protein